MLESGGEMSLRDDHHTSSAMKNDHSNSSLTSLAEILTGWVSANMWNPFTCDDVFERLVHQVVDAGCIVLSPNKRLDAESTYILQKEAAEEKINNFVSFIVIHL